MAGHRVTPYELIARRKGAKAEERQEPLLLASVAEAKTIDLLDVIESHVREVPPIQSKDQSWQLECVGLARAGEVLSMVFAVDISGERENIYDGSLPGRPLAFTKDRKHVTRFYSCCLLWRPAEGKEGRLLVHSPWGRGGSRTQITQLLQRAVNIEPEAKIKIATAPIIPAEALRRFLDQAKATKITYSKHKGIASTFGDAASNQTTLAEMDLVVKGSDTVPYRDALKAALRASKNREGLFTIRLRDDEAKDGYRSETFDDVTVDLQTSGGTKRYSMRTEAIPTISFDLTSEINNVYYALPGDDPGVWAKELLSGVTEHLERLLRDVKPSS